MIGMGVIIHELTAAEQKGDALAEYMGYNIVALSVDNDANGGDGAIRFTVDGGRRFEVKDDGRSCCEQRYLTCDDDLAAFIGATLMGCEVRGGGEKQDPYGVHETAFLVFHTSIGDFTVCTHNEHNGYYGGFWPVVKALEGAK